jgi:hypothetical protein
MRPINTGDLPFACSFVQIVQRPLCLHPAGHFVAATACAVEFVLLRVVLLAQLAIHFGAKLRLTRLHAFVAHRLVFGGVRLDLRAVERDMPQLRQPGFFRQLQHLQ